MRRTLALTLLSLLALTLLSHAVASEDLLPEEDPANAADGPVANQPENDVTSDLEEEDDSDMSSGTSLDEVAEEGKKRRQKARESLAYLKRLADIRRAKQARLVAAWRLKRMAHLNRMKKIAAARSRASNLKSLLAKRAARQKKRAAAKKAGKPLPKRKRRGLGLKKQYKKVSAVMKKRAASIAKTKAALRKTRRTRATAQRSIRKDRRVLKSLTRMKARAKEFVARLAKAKAELTQAKRKIPARLIATQKKADASLKRVTERIAKVVKRLKANVAKVRANSLNRSKELKKRVRTLRKPATDMVRKIRSVARSIGKKVQAAVQRVRKQGKLGFKKVLSGLVQAARKAKNPRTKRYIYRQIRRLAALGRLAFQKIGKVAREAGKKTKKALSKTAEAKKKAARAAAVARAAKITKGTDLKRRTRVTSAQARALAAEHKSAQAKMLADQKKADKVHSRGCAASCRTAGKALAKAERLRAKELKLIAFVKGKLGELTSLDGNEEVQKALELLSITRAHQEIVGPKGVTFLLTKLEEKLRGVSKKSRIGFNNKRNSCEKLCGNSMKYHKDRLVKSQENKAKARHRLNKANDDLQLTKGKEAAARALYGKARSSGLKLLGRNSREQELLRALLKRVDQLAGVSKASESALSAVEIDDDSDLMTELQTLAPDNEDLNTVLVAMTRNHPEVRAIKKLLSDLLQKTIKEQDETREDLRRKFRAHRRAGTETRLMQMAQKSAQWALRRVRNAVARNMKRVERSVKSCSGIPDKVSV